MNPRRHFLLTTLALLAVAGAVAVVQGWSAPRPAPAPPRRPAAPTAALAAPAPTAAEILERADRLGVSAGQRRQLEQLASGWAAESAPLQAQVDNAAAEFSTFMDRSARTGGGATLAEIQRRSAEASELAARLRERRRQHAAAAADVLDERQRAALATTSPVRPGGTR